LRRIAGNGDDVGRSLRADAVDGGQQAADLMLAQFAFDVVVELTQPSAQDIEILAGVANLDAVGGAVVLTHRTPGGGDECSSEVEADLMPPVIAQRSQAL